MINYFRNRALLFTGTIDDKAFIIMYEQNNVLCKENENYKLLNSNMSQQILKEVDGSFKSFFGLLKLAKKGKYDLRSIKIQYTYESIETQRELDNTKALAIDIGLNNLATCITIEKRESKGEGFSLLC